MQQISTRRLIAPKVRRISEHRLRDLLFLLLCRPDRLLVVSWWRLVGKKLRARLRLEEAMAALPFAHERWVEAAGKADLAKIAKADDSTMLPKFSAHLHCASDDDPRQIRRRLGALLEQSHAPVCVFVTFEHGCLHLALPKSEKITVLNEAVVSRMEGLYAALTGAKAAGAGWIIPVTSQFPLPRHALAAYIAALLEEPDSDDSVLLFADEQSPLGRFRKKQLWLKPQWDPRMILSQDYVSSACALKVAAACKVLDEGPGAPIGSLYELVLRMGLDAAPGAIGHVDRIGSQTDAMDWRSNGEERLEAVKNVLDAAAKVGEGPYGTIEVQYPLPEPPPSVSIIVATRDRVELLRACVNGVLNHTDYPDFELIVADNESIEPETLAYMDEIAADPRVRVIRWPHPFNYSAINNFAVREAKGDYICLLNNDIEVIEPQWLSEMMREAVQPDIGAVGARLLYPDRSIQHAGVAIGIGNAAGHAHRGLVEGEPGYFAQALIPRGASAVTGACLLVSKRDFDAVGGLDEERFGVAYNDVDLCLKLRACGKGVIYTPLATLVHHESKSRGLDFAPENLERYLKELAAFQCRWEAGQLVDPWHHPKLSQVTENYRTN